MRTVPHYFCVLAREHGNAVGIVGVPEGTASQKQIINAQRNEFLIDLDVSFELIYRVVGGFTCNFSLHRTKGFLYFELILQFLVRLL